MGKIYSLVLIIFLSATSLTAKNDRPWSIYGYGGYPVTIFEVNTPVGAFGNIGLKYHVGKGFNILGGAYVEMFNKSFDANNTRVHEYNTKLYGADIGLMYEIDLGNRWTLGPALLYKQAYFSITGLDAENKHYYSKNYDKAFYKWNVMQYGYLLLQFRKPISERWDFLGGASYVIFEGNYLDIFPVKYRFNDMYLGLHVGLNFHLGNSGQMNGGYNKLRKKFRQIYCPKF